MLGRRCRLTALTRYQKAREIKPTRRELVVREPMQRAYNRQNTAHRGIIAKRMPTTIIKEKMHSKFWSPKRSTLAVIGIQLAATAGVVSFSLAAKASGGFLGGRWYPYCENGYNGNGLGNYFFCVNGSNYRIQYASGDWIQSYCGATVVYRSRTLSESQAAWFHGQVCGRQTQGGSNWNDVMIEMMRMMGQQYRYF